MNKITYIPDYFLPIGTNKTIKVSTGKTKKSILGYLKEVTKKEQQWEQTGWSDSAIDGVKLSEDLMEAIKKLNNDDYEVISVTPITSGKYNYEHQHDNIKNGLSYGYGFGYGYSYTNSLIVVSKKITFLDAIK